MPFTLTNDFTPAQRAFLHQALIHIKEQNADQKVIDTITPDRPAKIFQEFQQFADNTIEELLQKLFHDCFLEDLDFVKHFAKQRNSVLNSNTTAAAI